MQKESSRVWIVTVVLLMSAALPALAEDKITAFVSQTGRVVFTNLVDNAPGPVEPILPTNDVLSLEMPERLRALVDTISQEHGVDPALVRAVMKTESNFNRWAVSPKGALGLMQLIPTTGRRFGVQDFFDPEQNIGGGVRYLKFLLEKFNGNLDLSLAAYNAGENVVEKLGRIPPIPETTNYVRKVRATYKKSPEVVLAAAPAVTAAKASAPGPAMVANETPRIYRSVDRNGVVTFSNVGPSN